MGSSGGSQGGYGVLLAGFHEMAELCFWLRFVGWRFWYENEWRRGKIKGEGGQRRLL